MTTGKYVGDQSQDMHGGQLVWPGGPNGFPLRATHGHPLMPRQQEYQQTQAHYDFKCKEFCTNDHEQMAEYRQLMDWIANGYFRLMRRLEQYDPEKKGWKFWVEWVQVYETPAGPPAGPGGY